MPEVDAVLARMSRVQPTRSATAPGAATPARPITDVVNIGIGGSDLGPA